MVAGRNGNRIKFMQRDLQKIFLLLLQRGLWGKRVKEEVPPLTAQEWEQIYQFSRKQAVQGIVYDGVNTLDSTLQPPMALMIRWTVEIDSIERANKKQANVIYKLYNLFTQENGLPFILLKGQANGACYPTPTHRVCGDIDLYFYDKTEKAHRIIEGKGIYVDRERHREGSNNGTYDYEGVPVDHRIRFMTLHNPFTRKRLKKIQNSRLLHGEQGTICIKDISVPILSAETNHVMQIAHILKHLLTEGVGLRQCCDLAMTLYATRDSIDNKKVAKTLKSLGLHKFALLMYSFIENYLGYPKEKLPQTSKYNAAPLLEEIWESGNFGQMDERNTTTTNEKKRKLNTFSKVMRKCLLFARYAPGEAFWWPLELICTNIKTRIKR